MLSAGRLSFSHKWGANSVALPLVCHYCVRLEIVKGETLAQGKLWELVPTICVFILQLHWIMSGEHFGFEVSGWSICERWDEKENS